MQKKITSLSDEQILDYVFSTLSDEDKEDITKFLLENDEEREVVEGLMDLCLDKHFSREQFVEYLNSIDFKGTSKNQTNEEK